MPSCDFLSTIPYISDSGAALTISRTKRFDSFDEEELVHLSGRVGLAKAMVLDTAGETVELFRQHWNAEKNKIDKHLGAVPLAQVS